MVDVDKILKYLKNPFLIYSFVASKGFTRLVPDETHLKLMYRAHIGRKPDLINPRTFNEKIQWLKLHNRNPDYVNLVDKYEVKKWVSEKIGSEYLASTYACWDSIADIDIAGLPKQFVLKTNHDCGGVVICRDRETFDIASAKLKLKKHLRTNYFWGGREWPYKGVKPLVFAEQFLGSETSETGSSEFVDYKFMCFSGRVRCIFTCTGRESGDLRVDFFDNNWNHLPFQRHYSNADIIPSAPENLSFMLEAAEILAAGIPFVRVDFYEIESKPYFGEMTFYPGSGFEEFTPDYWDLKLGDWIELPNDTLQN